MSVQSPLSATCELGAVAVLRVCCCSAVNRRNNRNRYKLNYKASMDEFLTSASPRLDKKNLTSSHLGACFFVFSFRIKVLEYVAPVSASEE